MSGSPETSGCHLERDATSGEEAGMVVLPLDVLSVIVHCGGTANMVAVRGVCRAWRQTFDAAVKELVITAPLAAAATGAPPLPLDLPALNLCTVSALGPAALRRVTTDLAAHSPQLARLRVTCSVARALPETLCALTALTELGVRYTALATLPAGLSQLSGLKVLDLNSNALVFLPEGIATALPSLASLSLRDNLLTELPPLPPSLLELDVSANRLKRLEEGSISGLTRLTNLTAVGAFSHRPHGEGCPTVGALARLSRVRGGALSLRLDGAVSELVRARLRFGGSGGGEPLVGAGEGGADAAGVGGGGSGSSGRGLLLGAAGGSGSGG